MIHELLWQTLEITLSVLIRALLTGLYTVMWTVVFTSGALIKMVIKRLKYRPKNENSISPVSDVFIQAEYQHRKHHLHPCRQVCKHILP